MSSINMSFVWSKSDVIQKIYWSVKSIYTVKMIPYNFLHKKWDLQIM